MVGNRQNLRKYQGRGIKGTPQESLVPRWPHEQGSLLWGCPRSQAGCCPGACTPRQRHGAAWAQRAQQGPEAVPGTQPSPTPVPSLPHSDSLHQNTFILPLPPHSFSGPTILITPFLCHLHQLDTLTPFLAHSPSVVLAQHLLLVPCKEMPCKSPCGLQREFPNDTLINSSCCQMLFAFTFRTVCINNKYLHLEIIYTGHCSHVTATGSGSGLGGSKTLWSIQPFPPRCPARDEECLSTSEQISPGKSRTISCDKDWQLSSSRRACQGRCCTPSEPVGSVPAPNNCCVYLCGSHCALQEGSHRNN